MDPTGWFLFPLLIHCAKCRYEEKETNEIYLWCLYDLKDFEYDVKNHNIEHVQRDESALEWMECENRNINRKEWNFFTFDFLVPEERCDIVLVCVFVPIYFAPSPFLSIDIKQKSIDWSIRYDPLSRRKCWCVKIGSKRSVATVWSQFFNLMHSLVLRNSINLSKSTLMYRSP